MNFFAKKSKISKKKRKNEKNKNFFKKLLTNKLWMCIINLE